MRKIWMTLMTLLVLLALTACQPGEEPPAPESAPAASSEPAEPLPAPAEGEHAEAAPDPLTEEEVQRLGAALDLCAAYGPGEAGSSLKQLIGASALLDCAADFPGLRDWQPAVSAWLETQEPMRQELFWMNWPGLVSAVEEIGTDPAALAPMLEDAGSPTGRETYEPGVWEPLLAAIGALMPKSAIV